MTCSRRAEPLDAEEGDAVTDSVDPAAPSGEGLAGIVRRAMELHELAPATERYDGPVDFARNKKHYLYGHPREDD